MAAALTTGCEPTPAPESGAEAKLSAGPANDVKKDGLVPNWAVIVFDIKTTSDREQSEDYFRATFDKDYLEPIGGQAKAALAEAVTVAYKNEAGEDKTAAAKAAEADWDGLIASEWSDDSAGRKIAYGFCTLRSQKDQKVTCYFGSDDEANVWVNGKLAHEIYEARSCEPRTDEFTVDLKKGLNTVMVKASQRSASWVFVLEVMPAE